MKNFLKKIFSLLTFAGVIAGVLASCTQEREEPVIATDPLDNYVDWAIYRGDKKGNQYAELAQIHAANVHKLELVRINVFSFL